MLMWMHDVFYCTQFVHGSETQPAPHDFASIKNLDDSEAVGVYPLVYLDGWLVSLPSNGGLLIPF